jgi:hypothetical protein
MITFLGMKAVAMKYLPSCLSGKDFYLYQQKGVSIRYKGNNIIGAANLSNVFTADFILTAM